MPTKPEPKSWMELLDRVLGDSARTSNAVRLMLTCALALALVLAPVLVVVCLFGTTGAAIVGGVGTLATAGGYAARRSRRREINAKAGDSPAAPRGTADSAPP